MIFVALAALAALAAILSFACWTLYVENRSLHLALLSTESPTAASHVRQVSLAETSERRDAALDEADIFDGTL